MSLADLIVQHVPVLVPRLTGRQLEGFCTPDSGPLDELVVALSRHSSSWSWRGGGWVRLVGLNPSLRQATNELSSLGLIQINTPAGPATSLFRVRVTPAGWQEMSAATTRWEESWD